MLLGLLSLPVIYAASQQGRHKQWPLRRAALLGAVRAIRLAVMALLLTEGVASVFILSNGEIPHGHLLYKVGCPVLRCAALSCAGWRMGWGG